MTRHLNKLEIDLSKLSEIIDTSINSLKELLLNYEFELFCLKK